MIELIINILSGLAIPIILWWYGDYFKKAEIAKKYIDTHKYYDCVIKDLESNFASVKNIKYDINQIYYLILTGRPQLKPVYKYIKKCYKKDIVPDKEVIKNYISEIRKKHCECYTFSNLEE